MFIATVIVLMVSVMFLVMNTGRTLPVNVMNSYYYYRHIPSEPALDGGRPSRAGMDDTLRIIDESLALLSRPHVLVPPEDDAYGAVDGRHHDAGRHGAAADADADGLAVTPLRERAGDRGPGRPHAPAASPAAVGVGGRNAEVDDDDDDDDDDNYEDPAGRWIPSPGSSFGPDPAGLEAQLFYANGSRRPQTAPRRLVRGSGGGRQGEFRGDAVAAVTSQLLAAQAQCRQLEEDKARLEELLRASNRFLPPQPPPTKGQTAVAKALKALEGEVKRRLEKAPTSPRGATKVLVDRIKVQSLADGARETRSQVASLKVLLSSSTETNTELEEALARVEQEHARRVSDLEAQVHTAREAAAAARARSPRSERPATLVDEEKVQRLEQELMRVKEQYLRLYEYCQDQEQAHRNQ